jgi:mevalonate kinase
VKIIGTAPGKLILFGEHGSSRNKPAIVFAIKKRLKITLTKHEKTKKIILSSRELEIENTDYPDSRLDLVSKAIELFLQKMNCLEEKIALSIESDIPAGFGSSAAVIVATLGVLDKYYQTNLSSLEILELGLEVNYAIKGYGSGLDIGAAVYGGLIKYQKGFEPKNLPYSFLHFVIGSTGVKADSSPIVKAVKLFEEKNPAAAEDIFNEMEIIAYQAEKLLEDKQVGNLGWLMNKNQDLLRKLNVSSPILEEMIAAAKNSGALGAKLSGAGVGDNMIALTTENNKQSIINALNKTKGNALPDISIDSNGLLVKIEE